MSRAFATVGTTQFDALTSTLLSRELLETLRRQGYGELLVQYGRGAEPAPPTQPPLDVGWVWPAVKPGAGAPSAAPRALPPSEAAAATSTPTSKGKKKGRGKKGH